MIWISLKFVPKGPINNIPALVRIMAWRRPGDKPLSEPMIVRLPTHICVTRPQWVKNVFQYTRNSIDKHDKRELIYQISSSRKSWHISTPLGRRIMTLRKTSLQNQGCFFHGPLDRLLLRNWESFLLRALCAGHPPVTGGFPEQGASNVKRVYRKISNIRRTKFPNSNVSRFVLQFSLPNLMKPGPWFNLKMPSYQYRKSNCGNKSVVRSSYLHNGISYTGKMASLYWIGGPGVKSRVKM